MQPDLGKRLIKRADELKALRQPHEQVWRDAYDYSFPIRGNGIGGDMISAGDAAARNNRLHDSTAADSSTILASNILSGLTPANSRWFGFDVDDPDEQGKKWLDAGAQVTWENIHNSNYDAAAFECCLDVTIAGWFVLFIDVDREIGGFVFEQWALGQTYCAASKPGGVIDTFYRYYELTAEQALREFDKDNLSSKVREAAEKEPDKKIKFLRAIYPRANSMANAVRAKNLPFASVYVECDGAHVVRESGFHEQPCVAPRWMGIPDSVYGIGPLDRALPDVRTLNEIKRMGLINLDMANSGMWVAVDDGVLNPRNIKVGPRRVIVANSVESIKPLTPGGDFNLQFTSEERLQQAIRKIMMADQLQPQDGPKMTAYEVSVRVQMIRQLLGPVYGRFQAEFLKLMVFRCFGLAMRAGIIPPAPASVGGKTARVTYISPLARAQQLEEVTAIQQTFGFAQLIAQATGDQSIFDTLDAEKGLAIAGEGFGMPQSIMRDPDDVAKIRKARADAAQEQAQQEQQAQVAQVGAEAAAKQAVAA